MANPQKENGSTSIANEVLEKLISASLNGTELAICLFVIRKTYGWNKLEDEISLSQFLSAIPVSKQSLCTALNNLQLVKILRLVKKGNSKLLANCWAFNKDFDSWQLVRKVRLVKFSSPTSQVFHKQLVKKTRHTKYNIQNTIQNTLLSESDFENFWKLYPNKKGKIEAQKKFLKLPKELLPKILSKLELYKKTEQWQNPRYIPHGSTFVSQQLWEDEVETMNLGQPNYPTL